MSSVSPAAIDVRQALIDSAYSLFLACGDVSAVTMRRVGQRAGVSAMAAYAHFANKDELLTVLVDRGFAQMLALMSSALMQENPVERLREVGRKVFQFGRQYPQLYHLIFIRSKAGDTPDANASTDWRGAATYEFLATQVQACIDAGAITGVGAHALALTLWSATHGLLSMRISQRLWMPEEEFTRLFWTSLDLLMDKYLYAPYAQINPHGAQLDMDQVFVPVQG